MNSALKILVVGGMHGNEKLGIDLVKRLQSSPLVNVSTLIANPKAVELNKRFFEADLNRSFGFNNEPSYESSRAAYVRKYVQNFDVVLDFHNTETPNNNCCFVGIDCDVRLYSMASQIGFNKCIEATYDCINKDCANVLSVEVSKGDTLDDPEYWYNLLKTIDLSRASTQPVSVYRFRRRVTWDEKKSLSIEGWRPFKPIDASLKPKFGLNGIIVPIFIGSKLTEYYATLLSKERTV